MVSSSPSIHHTVILTADLEASLRFYRDGIGLSVLQDRVVEGDWPGLFGATSTTLRAVFLGNPDFVDDNSGVLELNSIEGTAPAASDAPPRAGLFMVSYFVDVEEVLGRIDTLGLAIDVRRVEQPTPNGAITIATVRDPDGVTVLLTPGSITQTK